MSKNGEKQCYYTKKPGGAIDAGGEALDVADEAFAAVRFPSIPLAAYDYVVHGKSAIEWVMERYQVTTNKNSGIVNDPNKWLAECGTERYIVDLILKVVAVSMEALKIVLKLPKLEFRAVTSR